MRLACPSAPADADDALVIGVVGGTSETPNVAYLSEPVPVTAELIASTLPAAANEVLRTAAACAERSCRHFDGASCMLAARIVAHLPTVVSRPPRCAIRPTCRWWKQEGRSACVRCPQIVTESRTGSPSYLRAASAPSNQ